MAVVAVVAVLAFPVSAPTKVVDVTLVKPAIVVADEPKLMAVEPIVMLELVRAEFGMLVKLAPDPLKTVAVKVPVLGTYFSFVELVSIVVTVPLVALTKVG